MACDVEQNYGGFLNSMHSELVKSNSSTEHFSKISSLCNKDQRLALKLQGTFKATSGEHGQKTWESHDFRR